MNEKWIGEEVNTSGTYIPTECSEISLRRGGPINAIKLYKFHSRFGVEYYITDSEVVDTIDNLLPKEDPMELYEFLYGLVIKEFGIVPFITKIELELAQKREEGFRSGKKQMQQQMRELLGIR